MSSRDRAREDIEHHLHYLTTVTFPLLKEAGDLSRSRWARNEKYWERMPSVSMDSRCEGHYHIVNKVELLK